MKGLICAVVATSLWMVTAAPADGNPHNWDRRRRCDHVDYDPPCGICEGYGGLATGDKNDQITLAACVPVADSSKIDPATLKRPIWGKTFTARKYSEILIGPKLDPFCFQVFPSNSSAGELCYRPDEGSQYYDMTDGGPKELHEELNVYTTVGNVTSTIIHQDVNFWVINKFPWYAAGVHQCICTNIHEGISTTAKFGKEYYPIMSNWTNHLGFVGRENITVEYGVGMKTLDHWAFGPHHVWVFPESGYIQRMWQPFNGLQVFGEENGNGHDTTVDPAEMGNTPPALCKKGGSLFRIKCSDEGYPIPANKTAEAAVNKIHGGLERPLTVAHQSDAARAANPVPRAAFKGETFDDMSAVLNQWLVASSVQTKPCGEWSAEDLQQLQAFLYLAKHSELDAIYQAADDNRKLRQPIETMQADWARLNELVAAEEAAEAAPAAHSVQRDGHCHEAVMWWVHHLTEDTKQLLVQSQVTIPLLSQGAHDCSTDATAGKHEALAAACKVYEDQVTCASCHSKI